MRLAPNGKSNDKQDNQNIEVVKMIISMDDIHNDIKTTFIKQTEVKIPKSKRIHTDKTITAE